MSLTDQLKEFASEADSAPTNRLGVPRKVQGGTASYSFLYPPVQSDEIGRLGNYRVLKLLGMGGMGMVFQAEDIALCRAVALKVMKPHLQQSDGAAWSRFLREARTMAAIKHDHLVTVFQVGQENGNIYLAMELLEGETLQNWIHREAQPEVAEIVRIGKEIAKGLAVIHERGLIHRDIKPANLWLEAPKGRVKILDFGLTRATDDDTHLTNTGVVVGTPAFASPEQARGKPLDARSDLFSLGCVLYQMCSKELPFPAENTCDQLAALAADPVMPVRQRNPRIPVALATLIEQLLAKNPDERPASATAVVEQLLEIKRAGSGVRRKGSTEATERVPYRTAAKKRRGKKRSFLRSHRTKMLLVLVFLTLAALAGAGVMHLMAVPPPPPPPPAGTDKGTLLTGEKIFLTDLQMLEVVNWPFHKPKNEPGSKGPPPDLFGPIVSVL